MLLFIFILLSKNLVELIFFRIFAANFNLTAKLYEILSNIGHFMDLLHPFGGLCTHPRTLSPEAF